MERFTASEFCENCAAFEPFRTGSASPASGFISKEIHLRTVAVAEQTPPGHWFMDMRPQLYHLPLNHLNLEKMPDRKG
jgi:hypothetical protein